MPSGGIHVHPNPYGKKIATTTGATRPSGSSAPMANEVADILACIEGDDSW